MRLAKVLSFLLVFLLPLLFWVSIANAQSFRTGSTVTVGRGETVDSSLWTSGQTIDIAGEVNGDIYCVGQNINITGKVKGDVICAAQTINISGSVEGSVRSAAQTLTFSSEVGGSASVAAQNATLESNGSIGRDFSVAAQETNLNGDINRDLALASQDAIIGGNVGRNVKANVENLTINSQATVGGNVDYTSVNEARTDPGSQISGNITRTQPAEKDKDMETNVGFNIIATLVLLATALVLVLLFPRIFHKTSNYAVDNPGKIILIGLAFMFLGPVLVFGIAITLIGIPLALLLFVAWLLILALSGAFAAYYIGRLIWRGQTNPVLLMLAGGSLLLILRFFPIIGFLATLLAVWMGSGMIVEGLRNLFPKPEYDTNKLK